MKRLVAFIPVIATVLALSACGAGDLSAGSSGSPGSGASTSSTQAVDAATKWYDDFGSFTPINQSGTSDTIVALPAGIKGGIVTATYQGESNFSVNALDANNQPTGDLLVNTIGSYSGTTAFGLNAPGQATSLQVQGSGAWTLAIAPISSAQQLTMPAQGKGDAVFKYDGAAGTVTLTHDGTSNFIVNQYAKDAIMPGMSVNQIGAYSGQVAALKGPSLVIIQADGNWTAAQ